MFSLKYLNIANSLNSANFYDGLTIIFTSLAPQSTISKDIEDRKNVVYDFKSPDQYTLEEMKDIVNSTYNNIFVNRGCVCGKYCDAYAYANLILKASSFSLEPPTERVRFLPPMEISKLENWLINDWNWPNISVKTFPKGALDKSMPWLSWSKPFFVSSMRLNRAFFSFSRESFCS